MVAKDILQADFLDIVFADRNKQYGAYLLRRTYWKRLLMAVAIMVALVVFSLWWIRPPAATESGSSMVSVREVVLETIKEVSPPPPPPPKQESPAPEKAASAAPAKPSAATIKPERTRFTPPVVKKDEEVRNSEMPPVSDIAVVDVVSAAGSRQDLLAAPVPVTADVVKGTGAGPGIVERPKAEENTIFEKVEIAASVNMAQWRQHLERKLVRYIEDAAYAGMLPGQYTVIVRFLVEKDGSISTAKALNDPGYGLGNGAEHVVKSGPSWRPGEQNGQKVRSYHTQPITFVIMET